MKLAKQILSLIIILLVTACSKQPSDTFADYQSRLASASDIEVVKPQPLHNIDIQTVSQPQSELSISVLDIAQTGHCKITNLIAAQNNQLGKVSYPSERLKYTIEFLQHAPDCITHPKTKKELSQILIQALAEKRTQLPLFFLHMMTNEKELASLGLLTTSEIPPEPTALMGDTLAAVNILADVAVNINDPDQIAATTITPALKTLSHRFISSLLTSLRKQTQFNTAATLQMKNLKLEEGVCRKGSNRKQAHIISNVFSKYYLNDIQPYQAMLTSITQQLIRDWQPIQIVFEKHGISDPLMLQSHLDELKASAKAHVIWWQNFYKLCEITPS
ncbi:DUF3080 family protein [Pseudoalteromonas sp. McH1-7]|uniref:DUF3080 family protein n=1 Tax=unclassified Pseudoalteromonas TaxID=194690 RepID=UPI001591199B|nr:MULTISPECIES: DUF3080 family protein [unclassified Pseudoalteromonas]NUZ10414.1 DUF3080 family protein [Pseudoalteromonas sp. McH1-7]USD27139.1 DUF3080 family protein [Pseudoalteromonas sp. SCSIO 43201]